MESLNKLLDVQVKTIKLLANNLSEQQDQIKDLTKLVNIYGKQIKEITKILESIIKK